MKVAQLLYSGLGGHGSVAFSLISGDEKHRWSNVLCFVGAEPLLPAYRARCEELKIPHVYVPTRRGRPWLSWRKVFQWLSRERPDAILVHSTTVLTPCIVYARMRGVPLIFVEHQSFALKRRRDWKLSAMAMRLADRVILLSNAFAEGLRARLGGAFIEGKVAVIPNGIDLALFAPAAGRPAGRVRIGMAARFTPTKRQDLLVATLRRLKQQSPGVEWQLSFAGAGDTQRAIRRAAADLGASISFEGSLDEEALADWFRSLRIYALASDGEAFSTSILQAMATGLPVIASDVGGIRDQLSDEIGIVLPNDDVEGWVETVVRLTQDPELADRLGENGRRICERLYSARAMHAAYDRLIGETITRRTR